MEKPKLLRFDIDGLVKQLRNLKTSRRITDAQVLRLKQVAPYRLPLTVHVLASKRKKYPLNAEVWEPCGNSTCPSRATGEHSPIRCEKCGYDAYCSMECRETDAKLHAKQCLHTASYEIRRIYPRLVEMLDKYFGSQKKLLRKGLPVNQYLTPLSPRRFAEDSAERKQFEAIEMWLRFQIAKHIYKELPTEANGGGIKCMTCEKETKLNLSAVKAIIVTEQDTRDDIELDGVMRLGDIDDIVQMEFLGVDETTTVHGRFYICCSEQCHKTHNSLVCPYGTFDLWPKLLSGNVSLNLEYYGHSESTNASAM